MSYRTLVEINHDHLPDHRDERGLLRWAAEMRSALAGLTKDKLPAGVAFVHRRHHSEPCPLEGVGDPR